MKKIKLVVIGIIILTVCISLTVLLLNGKVNNEENNIVETNKNSVSVNGQNNTKNVAIVGIRSLIINANTKDIKINLKNPIENEGLYYQTFEIRLLNANEEGYEVLYKSDMIKPGEEINEIMLSRGLSQGEYDAILYVQPYHMNEQKTPTSDAKIKFKIVVK